MLCSDGSWQARWEPTKIGRKLGLIRFFIAMSSMYNLPLFPYEYVSTNIDSAHDRKACDVCLPVESMPCGDTTNKWLIEDSQALPTAFGGYSLKAGVSLGEVDRHYRSGR
jgi:hypothetical protein